MSTFIQAWHWADNKLLPEPMLTMSYNVTKGLFDGTKMI